MKPQDIKTDITSVRAGRNTDVIFTCYTTWTASLDCQVFGDSASQLC